MLTVAFFHSLTFQRSCQIHTHKSSSLFFTAGGVAWHQYNLIYLTSL